MVDVTVTKDTSNFESKLNFYVDDLKMEDLRQYYRLPSMKS